MFSEKVNLALIGAGGRGLHNAMIADWWEVDRQARDPDIPERDVLYGKWNGGYEIRSKEEKVNFVALCDVDTNRSSRTRKLFPESRFYSDYRRMLQYAHLFYSVITKRLQTFHRRKKSIDKSWWNRSGYLERQGRKEDELREGRYCNDPRNRPRCFWRLEATTESAPGCRCLAYAIINMA